jgi:aminoglycoside phosphotransferase (APT) family kinase protein
MTESDVVALLLGDGVLDSGSVVDGDVRVVDASRRNANFRVLREDGPSLMLKSARRGAVESVEREALVLRLLAASGGSGGPPRFLPRLHAYNADRRLLAIELFRDADDLRQYHRRGRFPRAIAGEVGRALATLHGLTPAVLREMAGRRLIAPEPAALHIHRPGPAVLYDFSAASVDLLLLVQHSPELCAALDALRDDWRRDTFIHHDARWDNVLVLRSARRRPDIRLVDWESAGLGDRAWDLGAMLGDYLGAWVASVPVTARAEPASYLALAAHPLEMMQPAIRACWTAYVRTGGLDDGAAAELRVRVARYAGLKLLQIALENVQNAAESTMTAATLLQLGANVLLRPQEAGLVVLGLGPERP